MTAQENTIRQYHEWMQLNAVSHLTRAAREAGVFGELAEGQKTAGQLCKSLGLRPRPTNLLLATLTAIGVIERYGDDYALSAAARLLCRYDRDLGDARWERMVGAMRGEGMRPATERRLGGEDDSPDREPDDAYFDAVAATQWIHTSAAMQAAEILDIGGEGAPTSMTILDLGCGSGVWSCAMAYRDSGVEVTAVDTVGPLRAARRTADSIGLGDRFRTVERDPATISPGGASASPGEPGNAPAEPGNAPAKRNGAGLGGRESEGERDEGMRAGYDLVVIPQRLHAISASEGDRLLASAVHSARPGGRVAVIDLFQSPGRPPLAERIAALRIELDTADGRVPTLQETQQRLLDAGLSDVKFTFLAESREGLGIAVGRRA